jgi:hypothetical protein
MKTADAWNIGRGARERIEHRLAIGLGDAGFGSE